MGQPKSILFPSSKRDAEVKDIILGKEKAFNFLKLEQDAEVKGMI